LPIYQWTAGGERTLKLTAVFTADMDPALIEGGSFPQNETIPPFSGRGIDKRRNLDPRAAVQWLRYFTYPLYPRDSVRVHEPPKLLLTADGMRLSTDNGDSVRVILMRCPVVYEKCFPSGFPRIVVSELEFAESAQHNGRVRFPGRGGGGASFRLAGQYPLRVRGWGR
jgi:hypothetical protein